MTEHKTLAAALAAFQASLPAVHKGAQGQVPGKRDHRYADLADLSATVLPALGAQGLSWMTMPTVDDHGRFVLRYELLHTSGEHRTGDYPLSGNTAWEQASAQTYARRYCLSAVTGVAADDDDDGAAANEAAPTRRQKAKPTGPTADQLRETIANLAKAKNLDHDALAAEYEARIKTPLAEETDPGRLQKFIDAVNADRVQVPAAS